MNRIPKKFLSAAFIIFGIFLIFYYVRNFGVNVPIADDWNNVETSILWKMHEFNFKSLFALHNEHCLAASRLLSHSILSFTQGNFKIVLYFNAGLAAALLVVLILFIQKWPLPTPIFILLSLSISLAASSWCQWQNLLWAFQTPFFILPLALVFSGILLARSSSPTVAFMLAICATWLCIFTIGNGLFVGWGLVPAVLLRSMSDPVFKKRKFGVLFFIGLFSATIFATLLIAFSMGSKHGGIDAVTKQPLDVIFVGLSVLGSPLAPIQAFQHENILPAACGFFSIFYAAFLLFLIFKAGHKCLTRDFGVGFGLMIYGFLSVSAVVYARCKMLFDMAIESRYQALAIPWILGLLLTGCLLSQIINGTKRVVFLCITSFFMLVLCAGIVSGVNLFYAHGENMKKAHLLLQEVYRNSENPAFRSQLLKASGHYGLDRIKKNITEMEIVGILHAELRAIKHTNKKMYKPEPESVQLPLVFGKPAGHTSDNLSFIGWYDPEAPYRWNQEKKSTIKFHVDTAASRVTRLKIVGAPNGNQKLSLLLNGSKIYSDVIDGGLQEISVELPHDLLAPGENNLTFDMPDACVPGNGDTRVLGFAFGSLTLD